MDIQNLEIIKKAFQAINLKINSYESDSDPVVFNLSMTGNKKPIAKDAPRYTLFTTKDRYREVEKDQRYREKILKDEKIFHELTGYKLQLNINTMRSRRGVEAKVFIMSNKS